jgi:hypothetical protein
MDNYTDVTIQVTISKQDNYTKKIRLIYIIFTGYSNYVVCIHWNLSAKLCFPAGFTVKTNKNQNEVINQEQNCTKIAPNQSIRSKIARKSPPINQSGAKLHENRPQSITVKTRFFANLSFAIDSATIVQLDLQFHGINGTTYSLN